MALPVQGSGKFVLDHVPAMVSVEHVSFHYPNSTRKVLDDINLKIKQNGHIAIVGENGAGKSTLIRILTGLY